MPDLDQDFERLFTAYGAACHAAQLLERSFRVLLVAQQAAKAPAFANEAVGYIETETARDTLRDLFSAAQRKEYFTEAEIAKINAAVRKRNFLIHEFFAHAGTDTLTPSGRKAALVELQSIRDQLNRAREILEALAERYLLEFGLTVETLVAAAQTLATSSSEDDDLILH